jgi:hypothetical protein
MKIDGSCHCGFITFTADIDPDTAGICHCTDCQTFSGSAFRTLVRSLPGTFKLVTGTPTLYIKTTAESGRKRQHAFCPRCGTPIYATVLTPDPKSYSLRIGTLTPRGAIAPTHQIWARSRVPWLGELATLPAIDKQQS